MLLDRGQLQSSDDGYVLSGPIDRLAVPETLHALVAARIDANAPEDRGLLADGAALGQSFTLAALAGLTGRDEAGLLPGLDRLVRRELLIRDDDPRSPERGQYRFVQAVVRDVAYETLSKPDRRAKHLAAARYYEARGEDELAGVLASHYLEALRETPSGPEADALAAQTKIALRAAADRAAALHSWAVSYHHLVDALSIASDPAEVAALQFAVADAGGLLWRADAVDHALAAASIADGLGDLALRNRAWAKAAQIYTDSMRGAKALEILEPAAANLSEDEPGAAGIFGQLGRIYMMTDRNQEAVDAADRALRAAAPEHDTEVIIHALVTRGPAILGLGRAEEAEAILRGAVALADKAGNIHAALRARNNLRSSTAEDASVRDSLAIVDEAMDLAQRFGLPGWLTWNGTMRALDNLDLGQWDAARRDLDEVAEYKPDAFVGAFHGVFGPRSLACRTTSTAAALRWRMANVSATAVDTAPQVTQLAQDRSRALLLLGDPAGAAVAVAGIEGGGNDAWLILRGAAAAAALGDAPTADALLSRVEALEPRRIPVAVAERLRALVAALAARWDEAVGPYLSAISTFKTLDYNLEAAILGLEFGAFLGARDERARAAAEEAASWFAERGATGFVERYRAAFRAAPAPAAPVTEHTPAQPNAVEVS